MDYFEKSGISQSMLKLLRKTPADFYYRYRSGKYVESTTKSLEFGTKLDMALFEPDMFDLNYQLLTGQKTTTKVGYIAEGEYNDVMAMVENIRAQKISDDLDVTVGDLLLKAKTQVVLEWICPRTGLLRKGKPDIVMGNGDMFDLKSCEDASPYGFAKAAYDYGYHIQGADYQEGNRVQNNQLGKFFFIAVEKKAPYKVAVYQLSGSFLALGYKDRDNLIDKYIECDSTDIWPGYGNNIMELNPPHYIKL